MSFGTLSHGQHSRICLAEVENVTLGYPVLREEAMVTLMTSRILNIVMLQLVARNM